MTVNSPPYVLQNGSHSAALFRQATTSLISATGVCNPGELGVAATGTPSMAVTVAAGRAWIPGGNVTNISSFNFSTQGNYFALNDAAVTLTVAAADPTNPRIDSVYAAVNDSFYSGGANTAVLGVVTGTPAPSPVAPTIPTNAVPLATLAVAANATTIANANITGATTQVYSVASAPPALVLPYCDTSSAGTINFGNASFAAAGMTQTDRTRGIGVTRTSTTITVTNAGTYALLGSLMWTTNSTTGRRILGFAINGATSPTGNANQVAPASSGTVQQVYTELDLNANDNIALMGYQDSGASLAAANRRLLVRQLY